MRQLRFMIFLTQMCAVEGAYAPRLSWQERRGVLEYYAKDK